MHKKVVYTCLVGGYDDLEEPIYTMDGWDYICFSNDLVAQKDSIWLIRKIPFQTSDKRRLSRFAKLLPHLVLQDYNISLYLDSNINVLNNFLELRLDELIENRDKIAIGKHPLRNCIYDEAEVCMATGLDKKEIIEVQIEFYRKENYPKAFGLFENNVIFRWHMNEGIKELNEEWWRLYNKYSQRDQLSLVFIMWKFGMKCTSLFPIDFDIRNSKHFNYGFHKYTLRSRIVSKFRTIRQLYLKKQH